LGVEEYAYYQYVSKLRQNVVWKREYDAKM